MTQFKLKFLALLLSVALVILVLPSAIVLFSPIYIFRFITTKIAKLVRPDLKEILTARSTLACLEQIDRHNPAFAIVVVMVMEGRVSLESIRNAYLTRVLPLKLTNGEMRYPELHQYPVDYMGFKFWKQDDSFDLNNHIEFYKSTHPVTEVDLKAIQEEYLAEAFVPNRSPWKTLIVENYLPADGAELHTVFLSKVHHCVGDAYAFIKLGFEVLGQEVPGTNAKPTLPHRSLLSWFLLPFTSIFKFSEDLLLLRTSSAIQVPVGKRKKTHIGVTNKIQLKDLKRFKTERNVSLSSVIFAACATGLKTIMAEKRMAIPENVLCLLPFPLAGHPETLRNHMSYASILLPLASSSHFDERTHLLNESYKSLWTSGSPLCNAVIAKAIGGLFTPMALFLTSGLAPPVLISNVPADFYDLEYEGHKIVDSYAFCGLCNLPGISFFVNTFSGKVRIVVVAESSFVSLEETNRIVENVEKQLLLCSS